MTRTDNHGDYKARQIRRARVQRGRRPSVVGACDGRIRCRRRGVFLLGRSGLGIASAGGERAGHYLYSACRPNTGLPGYGEIVNRRGITRQTCRDYMAAVKCEATQSLGALPRRTGTCVAWDAVLSLFLRREKTMEDLTSPGKTRLSGVRRSIHPPFAGGGGKNRLFCDFARGMVPRA